MGISFLGSKMFKKNKRIVMIFLSVALSFLIEISAIFIFLPNVAQASEKIDIFVANNKGLKLQEYCENITIFLNSYLGAAYKKPEAAFKIDDQMGLLDYPIMSLWGINEADVIVYQGWGTCGQAAILIEDLLYKGGYETRTATFIGIDHEWAEVFSNGTWYIVDPWYIGVMINAGSLRNLKPAFQQATGVEVTYINGTQQDASHEHGY
jgi:hypothetical protein